jgi:hypothetical protein
MIDADTDSTYMSEISESNNFELLSTQTFNSEQEIFNNSQKVIEFEDSGEGVGTQMFDIISINSELKESEHENNKQNIKNAVENIVDKVIEETIEKIIEKNDDKISESVKMTDNKLYNSSFENQDIQHDDQHDIENQMNEVIGKTGSIEMVDNELSKQTSATPKKGIIKMKYNKVCHDVSENASEDIGDCSPECSPQHYTNSIPKVETTDVYHQRQVNKRYDFYSSVVTFICFIIAMIAFITVIVISV